MRSIYLSNVIKRTVSSSKNALSKHWRVHYPSTSMRQRRYATESENPYKWAQHPLKSPQDTISDEILTPREIRNGDVGPPRTAYIALGSNLGNRVSMIEDACNRMAKRGIKIKRTSSLWETEPMYVLDQESFINGVCEVETHLAPINLLGALQKIENDMGRKKVIDKGPRNIDLDILLYDDQAVNHERLKIPHPLMYEREFVLRPLAELIPGQTLDPASPWKATVDYLEALPISSSPISTLTPLRVSVPPLRALQSNRPTKIMVILNFTPDSFSDGGDLNPGDGELLSRMVNFHKEGASIFDFGGQSSAPGAKDVSAEEEKSRIIPGIRALHDYRVRQNKRWNDVVISVDTFHASVAEAAVQAGADIINDISAGQLDSKMLPTIARLGKTVCLMHMRGTPQNMNSLADYPEGVIPTIAKELLERVVAAEEAGIRRWRIILDPGIGFAKTGAHNLEILRRFDELRDWPGLRGLPWLVGSSRKNFIGRIAREEDPKKRVMGTAATVAAAVQGGADIVRVHDVKEMAQVAKMSDAIWRPYNLEGVSL